MNFKKIIPKVNSFRRRSVEPSITSGLTSGSISRINKWGGVQLRQQPSSENKSYFSPRRNLKHGRQVLIKKITTVKAQPYALVSPLKAKHKHNVGWVKLKYLRPLGGAHSDAPVGEATADTGITMKKGMLELLGVLVQHIKTNHTKLGGIFRLPGHALRIDETCQHLLAGRTLESFPDLDKLTGHDVASVLKKILRAQRDAGEPLINFECYTPLMLFVTKIGAKEADIAEQVRRTFQCLMPTDHRKCCELLFRFLQIMAEKYAQTTKMGSSQLAVCFTPSVIQKPPTEDNGEEPDPYALMEEAAEIQNVVKVVEHIIRNARTIFRLHDTELSCDHQKTAVPVAATAPAKISRLRSASHSPGSALSSPATFLGLNNIRDRDARADPSPSSRKPISRHRSLSSSMSATVTDYTGGSLLGGFNPDAIRNRSRTVGARSAAPPDRRARLNAIMSRLRAGSFSHSSSRSSSNSSSNSRRLSTNGRDLFKCGLGLNTVGRAYSSPSVIPEDEETPTSTLSRSHSAPGS